MTNENLMPEMSEKVDVILSKLMKAKHAIGAVKKDSKNPFHKSNYASLNAYIDASEDHLTQNGLILVQAGNGSFTNPMIVATLFHPESGQWLKSYLPILNPKQDSQGLGSSVTYMRRYSMATLLGLVSEDDDAETASGRGKFQAVVTVKKGTLNEINPEPSAEDQQRLDELMDRFEKDDRHLVIRYIHSVMEHFKWTEPETVKRFLGEKNLHDKFHAWKNKHKIADKE